LEEDMSKEQRFEKVVESSSLSLTRITILFFAFIKSIFDSLASVIWAIVGVMSLGALIGLYHTQGLLEEIPEGILAQLAGISLFLMTYWRLFFFATLIFSIWINLRRVYD
jgi:hypothetical protein